MLVYMSPYKAELGIGRVVEGYIKHMPSFGIEYVEDVNDAELIVGQAGPQWPAGIQPDIVHCHGLYPTGTCDHGGMYYDMNANVIENIRCAKRTTVPSQWVADMFARDMMFRPDVVPHGIDVEDWNVVRNHGRYILWGKGHKPGVVDATVVMDLAEKLPNLQFVTTFGANARNIKAIGRQPFEKMKRYVERAGVYLATTKETFGIQTLEAMAAGVPVVGYNYGGTSDIVEHLQTGWLAEPGDVDGLVDGIIWAMRARDQIGEASREAVTKYSWQVVCTQLRKIYQEVLLSDDVEVDVSIIIPCYNYGHVVEGAIRSALGQQFNGTFEVIVIDDGSTDDSLKIINQFEDQVTIISQPNSGVSEARNCGIRNARGRYILPCDADDELMPNTVAMLIPPLDEDRGLGITYGSIYNIVENGRDRKGEWPPDFCYHRQALGMNQVPSTCMFRRDAWERAGGYKDKYIPAEDAELWTRITTLGYDAKKVTEEVTYVHRIHQESLAHRMKTPVWADKPWASNPDLTPFGAPACEYEYASYPVHNYDEPWVSIIIPVGPGHENIVHKAIDSVWRQSLKQWELIVVNDSGTDLIQPNTGRPVEEVYPFIRVYDIDGRNVSIARNVGAEHAQADFLVFFDADDELEMEYIETVVRAYNSLAEPRYIYTDWLVSNGGSAKVHEAQEFDRERLQAKAIHPVTALVPKEWHEEAGGFDVELGAMGWEDWDYFLKMSSLGHEGVRVPKALLTYDMTSGERRERSVQRQEELLKIIRERHSKMGCRRCGSKKGRKMPNTGIEASDHAMERVRNMLEGGGAILPQTRARVKEIDGETYVRVKDVSGNHAKHHIHGAVSRKRYGRKRSGEEFDMLVEDQQAKPNEFQVVTVKQEREQLDKPQVPSISRPKTPTKRVENVAEDNDFVDIDITSMTVAQIKALELDPETAAEAYEIEAMTKSRKTVLAYLSDVAQLEVDNV